MKFNKLASITAIALGTSMLSQAAFAEWSANVGIVSDYHFRGIQQTESASASAGVDFEQDGFYAGVWTAEVEDGLEVDLYGGYSAELDSGLGLNLGYTSYQYTGDFDSAYNEINLGLSYGFVSFDYAIGEWDGEVGNEAATEGKYSVATVTLEQNGFYATFGKYGREFDGEYGEFGYGTDVAGFDVGVALVVSGNDLDDSESLYLSIGKSFSL